MNTLRSSLFVLVLIALVASSSSAAQGASVFFDIAGHYESIRQSLVHDSVDSVHENATAVATRLRQLEENFTAQDAGVDGSQADAARPLVTELRAAAEQLAAATDLATTRDAFYELSKPMVRFRALQSGNEVPIVAYCSMARRSWLQPEGVIGNPYHGQSMASCGEVVDR